MRLNELTEDDNSMFTGIIESLGNLTESRREGTNLHLKISSNISSELQVDQSVSHNGVCLTVTAVEGDAHWVTAVDETLAKSNIGGVKVGDQVNLERCLQMNGRFDGHIVQGHVDTTARVVDIKDEGGSWLFTFELAHTELMVEKGSVCINGVSLTCFDVSDDRFSVAIIPYTFEHTNFNMLEKNSIVNIEYDIVGKYIQKLTKTRLHQ
ncbi:riboflavin synthase alpha chain [Marinoscillum furvescens DSM 4134]|uniref:Riboflavin synthase n=2 Tax=Marinoscillum furvescens TaxID=1026 RepID=A0A3D9L163_MARFU|nr:riboflavin synthase alpha chain [Marinoscillum furvescens DSM 4134]